MMSDLLAEAKKLDITERIDLVEAIWDTLDESAIVDVMDVPPAHRQELDRRLDDPEARAAAPWIDARARIERGR